VFAFRPAKMAVAFSLRLSQITIDSKLYRKSNTAVNSSAILIIRYQEEAECSELLKVCMRKDIMAG
jgi:hypothetical protein